ncbi:MAG: cyclase family protein [Chloroflexi bacterium]|nr:MAG: cyclase family protein [Chloroflexota bacterium]
MTGAPLPRFDELPLLGGLGLRHAWGVFGEDDELGTLNLLTPERVREALALPREGVSFNLTLPLAAFDPPFYGRDPLVHTIFRVDRNYHDDRLDNVFPQASTHWDGLRHMRAREHGFWGGVTDDPEPGAGRLGIERWAERGIVGRGVLLDVEGGDPFASRSISPEELEAAAGRQGVELRPGDVLCVRTGWMARYRRLDADERRRAATSHAFAGLAAGEEMARWLWDHRFAAVACDNPAVEVSPGDRDVGSLHRRLLPLLGFALGELFDLDALARAAVRDGRWDFLFVSVPLNLAGGAGSPANAIAIR